jgi:hypothetical protein
MTTAGPRAGDSAGEVRRDPRAPQLRAPDVRTYCGSCRPSPRRRPGLTLARVGLVDHRARGGHGGAIPMHARDRGLGLDPGELGASAFGSTPGWAAEPESSGPGRLGLTSFSPRPLLFVRLSSVKEILAPGRRAPGFGKPGGLWRPHPSAGDNGASLFWIDVGSPDHFAPSLRLVGDELAEVGG